MMNRAAPLSSLRIGGKLGWGLGLLLAVILVMAGVAVAGLQGLTRAAQDTLRVQDRTIALREVQMLLLDMQSLTRGIVLTGSDHLKGVYDDKAAGFEAAMDRLLDLSAEAPALAAEARRLDDLVATLRDRVYARQIALVLAGRGEEAAAIERSGEGWPYLEKVLVAVDSLAKTQAETATLRREALVRHFARTLAVVAGAGLAAVILGVALALILRASLAPPLVRITGVLSRLAAREMLTDIPHQDRRDEVGDIARALVIFRDSMLETERLHREQQDAEAYDRARAQALARITDRFRTEAGDQVEAADRAGQALATSGRSLTDSVAQTCDEAGVVAMAAAEASTAVQMVAAATEELLASVAEISTQAGRSAAEAGAGAGLADEVTGTVSRLNESAARIGEVVQLISAIASQTNLLALNATIEAARAGEAGKGFAVVAGEVKSLANQTAQATEEIGRQIQDIQAIAGDAVAAMTRIAQVIRTISDMTSGIAAAVEEQQSATQEISRSVTTAAQGVASATAAIQTVSALAERSGHSAREMATVVTTMDATLDRLNSVIRAFIADVQSSG